jgi:membrane protein implicated in regulation of membrane protease activity
VSYEFDEDVDHDTTPPANVGLLALAGVLLVIPIIALMWVGSYAKATPTFAGFPFFIWYQFLWVFLCSAMTYGAYRLVLAARPHRPMRHPSAGDEEVGR